MNKFCTLSPRHARERKKNFEWIWFFSKLCLRVLMLKGTQHRVTPTSVLFTFNPLRQRNYFHGEVCFHFQHVTRHRKCEWWNANWQIRKFQTHILKIEKNEQFSQVSEKKNARVKVYTPSSISFLFTYRRKPSSWNTIAVKFIAIFSNVYFLYFLLHYRGLINSKTCKRLKTWNK